MEVLKEGFCLNWMSKSCPLKDFELDAFKGVKKKELGEDLKR
jgi:hypothetical protein